MTGARDFAGCTLKFDFQRLPLGYCATLEQEYQPLLVLRHKCGLPSSSASLVEKVSQRVFILTRVPGELDHHCLIFLHAGTE